MHRWRWNYYYFLNFSKENESSSWQITVDCMYSVLAYVACCFSILDNLYVSLKFQNLFMHERGPVSWTCRIMQEDVDFEFCYAWCLILINCNVD